MSASSPPMGSDVPAGSPLTDEHALEREFKSHYSALMQIATAELAEAATSAPRVVESAFRRAWDERERFHSEQELEAFLHDCIKHGAARERSRRAGLHRLDTHAEVTGGTHGPSHVSGPPDVDQAWAHLSQSLHRSSDGSAIQAKAGISRHGTAEHVASIAKQRSWLPAILVGIGALAVALGGIWYVNRLGDEGAIGHALAAADARPHISATGQMAIVSLDDGSKVTLAPESKLTVPKNFSDVMRVVKLDGAGTFTAAHAEGKPGLQIRARNAAITTTGTVLTVRAYPEDSAVTVWVKEGTVTVRVGLDSTHTVAAGHALRVEKSGAVSEPTQDQLDEAISWNDHKVTIVNQQLRDVLPQLKRWYGLDIKVLDLPLLDRPVTLRASADSPREAITAVEKSADLKFGYMDKTMIFRDARPAAKGTKKPG